MINRDDILKILNGPPYVSRKAYLNAHLQGSVDYIYEWCKKKGIEPIDFSDAVHYIKSESSVQNTCRVCGVAIRCNAMYCSNKCKKADVASILAKGRETMLRKTGSRAPLGSKQAMDKRIETCMSRFGTSHPSKNAGVRDSIRSSNIEAYSDINLRKKVGESVKRHNEVNPGESVEKRKTTNLARYGAYTTMSQSSVDSVKATLMSRYGTDNPFSVDPKTKDRAADAVRMHFKDDGNRALAKIKRLKGIISRYGSIDEFNDMIFEKNASTHINYLIKKGFTDKIISYDRKNRGIITCECEHGHTYSISLQTLNRRLDSGLVTCTECSPIQRWRSNGEVELYEWLSKYANCISNDKKILSGMEVDILIPDKNLAVEFNGTYWHSDIYKDKNYHIDKTKALSAVGYRCIHVWEDQWTLKKDIIKGRLLSLLGIYDVRIGARECTVSFIDSKTANKFYDKNHIQGRTNASINVALYHKGEIVSCMGFGKRKIGRNSNDRYELLRFCNAIGINVMGAFTKLFKNSGLTDKPMVSYADISWGYGSVYEKVGFINTGWSKPNYWYVIDGCRYHRYTFRKSELIKMGYDPQLTEMQIMDGRQDALRIYDCGNSVWVRHINNK